MHLLHFFADSVRPKFGGVAALLICTLLSTSLVNFAEAVSGRNSSKVVISKCCRLGDYLDATGNCVVGGQTPEKWVPKVYLLKKKATYKNEGELPPNMQIEEAQYPAACSDPEFFYGANNFLLLGNGSLYLNEKNLMVTPADYCVDKNAALVCIQYPNMDSLTAPQSLSKVKKCCGANAAYSQEKGTCIILNKSHELFHTNVIKSPEVVVVSGFPDCQKDDFALNGLFKAENLDKVTGQMRLDDGKTFTPAQFCIEHVIEANESSVNVFTCSEHVQPASVPIRITHQDIRFVFYSTGLLISVIFLCATLACGLLVPSNHHVLHWRCQTHYVACLLVGDLLLAITQITGSTLIGPACSIIAVLMHFFFLAAFFWLNTMCFNIWWTFRDFRPTSLERGQELCRLRIYEIYAWGVPLIISGIAAILDNLPSSPDDAFLRPRFGEQKCWFVGDVEILTYFFGPIGLLLVINLLLFASTAQQLTCGLWKRDDVKTTSERAALGRVCLKLVVVMGVTWVADVLSWIVGGPHYIWYFTDAINALQGVLIFIVVGCQPQVWAALRRLWSSKTGLNVTNTTHGQQHSSSSQGLPSVGESMVTNNTFTNNVNGKPPMETVC